MEINCFIKLSTCAHIFMGSTNLVTQTIKGIHLQCGRPGFDPGVGKIPWRRAWQPVPVFLPGESPGTEEPGRLQSMGPQKAGQGWAARHSTALNCLCLQGQNWKKGAERATSQGCSVNVQMYRPGSTLHRVRLSRSSTREECVFYCFLVLISLDSLDILIFSVKIYLGKYFIIQYWRRL